MGGILSLMDMFPGSRQFRDNLDVDEKQLRRVEGIICGMTPQERKRPEIINTSRRRRIAKGSGVEVAAVNELLKRFDMMRQMLSGFSKYEKMIKETGRVPNPRQLPNQPNPILNRIRHGGGRRFR
jgi:signal recognition particle subunit SRP54